MQLPPLARSLAYVYCKGLLAQGVYQYADLELHIYDLCMNLIEGSRLSVAR